jgi:predicted DNA-binding transcriptional regulator YafY
MARHESLLRLFRILHYLETHPGGLKVSEIHSRLEHDEMEVTPRTVHRDIDALLQCHLPLSSDGNGPESRWHLAPFAEIRKSIQFTYQEIFSLYVARKSLDHLKGTPIHTALETLFMKIEKLLGKDTQMFDELLANLAFRPQMTWHTSVAPLILDTVYGALEEGHPLRLVYRAEAGERPGQAAERLVGPECLYFANSSVYLIAVDLAKNEPRTYALARVLEAEMVTSSEYEKQGISPESLFKSSIGILNTGEVDDVEIRLTGPVGTYFAERRWHESQETVRTPDGVVLRLHVKINDELVRFVLGMGSAGTVLKPASLIAQVEATAADILERYPRKNRAS